MVNVIAKMLNEHRPGKWDMYEIDKTKNELKYRLLSLFGYFRL